jgi:large conductance mechanosensitive channel
MKNLLNEFKEFALRGNVMDLAIGVIIGAAFTGIVNSLVDDILMPPIGMVLGNVDFSDLFISLDGTSYSSLANAQEAGAATINYGLFINQVVNFLIVALVVFLLIKQINRLTGKKEAGAEEEQPQQKDCPYCYSSIPEKASRCPQCTSELTPTASNEES